jgi:poly-gamma-glutamate capsule biosynthesis protein CapA/YwtB (metallophosphatase superfamily)
MDNENLTMLGVGDILLNTKDPTSMFKLVAPVLRSADVVVGQLETPCTTRAVITAPWGGVGHPAGLPRGCDPKKMDALRFAGFNVIHLAGNKIWDAGIPGIADTISGLRDLGIAPVGAGMNLDEARAPAITEHKETRIGFLSYNCVGPKETWANPLKPGCAWVRIVTAYEMDHPTPGGNPTIYTFAEPDSLKAMLDDIHNLRPLCDILVVHFHKGIGMTPVKLAMYEQPLCYAAIDAGADLILGDHTHILKGIEQYMGKIIFHGLGHFLPSDSHINPNEIPAWMIQQQRKIFKESFGFTLSESQSWPDVPNANLTIVSKCYIERRKISKVSFLPCLINHKGQPEILKHDARGKQVFDYMVEITQSAGLNGKYEWKGDEVVISS